MYKDAIVGTVLGAFNKCLGLWTLDTLLGGGSIGITMCIWVNNTVESCDLLF